MGVLESTLSLGWRSSSIVHAETPAETVTGITVTPFDDDAGPFDVDILSSEIVGEGLSATVMKGVIRGWDKRSLVVALKVFRVPLEEGHQELYSQLYRKELGVARTLGAMRHYVLPFLGTAVLRDQPVIVSIFMRNGNLLQFIERRRPFEVNRQALILQVSEALAFLHEVARMAHGDLKCENILISNDGKPLLSDFGLSARIDAEEEEDKTTATAVRECNSVRFAAPELLTDEAAGGTQSARRRSKTPESDVWAFGMVVVQAFTGRRPWPDAPRGIVAHRILTVGPHPRPADAAPGLTDDWWAVCLQCWRADPRARPRMVDVFRTLHVSTKFVFARSD